MNIERRRAWIRGNLIQMEQQQKKSARIVDTDFHFRQNNARWNFGIQLKWSEDGEDRGDAQ